jgi:hypothetical protein
MTIGGTSGSAGTLDVGGGGTAALVTTASWSGSPTLTVTGPLSWTLSANFGGANPLIVTGGTVTFTGGLSVSTLTTAGTLQSTASTFTTTNAATSNGATINTGYGPSFFSSAVLALAFLVLTIRCGPFVLLAYGL